MNKDPQPQQQSTQAKISELSPLVYRKIIYHCMRYSSSKVYGALIGLEGSPQKIVDAFPLFHTPIVNPTFSLALDLIESNLKPEMYSGSKQQNPQIVGFYEFIEGPSSSDSKESSANMERIIDTTQQMKSMKILKVFISQGEQKFFEFFEIPPQSSEKSTVGNVKKEAKRIEVDKKWNEKVKEQISNGQHRFIIDFDAHLEEIELDFTNDYVKAENF